MQRSGTAVEEEVQSAEGSEVSASIADTKSSHVDGDKAATSESIAQQNISSLPILLTFRCQIIYNTLMGLIL